MRYFPFFFDLQDAQVLIVGGGVVAARKGELVSQAGARIRVVAPNVVPQLVRLVQQNGGEIRRRHYRKTDLHGCKVVVCAAGLTNLNARVRADAKAARVPLNVVDQPKLCDFIFPAIVNRNPVCVAISSGGAAPVLARIIRNKLEAETPAKLGKLASLCEKYRAQVQARLPEKMRRRFWEAVLNDDAILSAALSGSEAREAEAEGLLRESLEQFAQEVDAGGGAGAGAGRGRGEVFIIGAGPGDPELMTFKAHRLLQKADVVFYDRLVSREVLELARRDAEKIFVGKTRARKVVSQERINQALVRRARAGEVVARLKGGDPFIFGRGGEEAAALAKAGVAFQVVPGVSAANGCAASAGIPLTHRGVARAVRFETAYRQDMMSPERWRRLADDREATLVFYMSGADLSAVADNLTLGGRSPQTPVAVVSAGTTSAQVVARGTLRNIAARAKGGMFSPALIIVGEVAKQNFAQLSSAFASYGRNPASGRGLSSAHNPSEFGFATGESESGLDSVSGVSGVSGFAGFPFSRIA